MAEERKAVTVVKGWRQFALFPRAEIKVFTLSRWQWIQARLREESRQSAQEGSQEGAGARSEPDGSAEPSGSKEL